MSELWDAYDQELNIIDGKVLVRGEEIEEGLYHLVSEIVVKHEDGTYLLMQRDPNKNLGGKWELSAGGAVQKGESAETGAFRELFEETGIKANELTKIGQLTHEGYHVHFAEYLCITGCDKDSIILQKGETVDYKWVDKKTLLQNLDEIISSRVFQFIPELSVPEVDRYLSNKKIIESIKSKYLAVHKEKTLKHVTEVSVTALKLAKMYNLHSEKVKIAAMLHDISVIMTPQEMYEMAKSRDMKLDLAEEKYHFLLHQKISKIIAEEQFGIKDLDVLNAIECHTTLKQNASDYDKVLFIADKISWDQPGEPPYHKILISIAEKSLDEACYFYMKYQFENNLLLMPHEWFSEAYEDLRSVLKEEIKDVKQF